MEISKEHLCILGLKILFLDNKFVSTIFSKPTGSHLYLQLTSYHSSKSVAVIQKGIVLRIRGICLSENEFSVKLEEYMAYLVMSRTGESKIRLY